MNHINNAQQEIIENCDDPIIAFPLVNAEASNKRKDMMDTGNGIKKLRVEHTSVGMVSFMCDKDNINNLNLSDIEIIMDSIKLNRDKISESELLVMQNCLISVLNNFKLDYLYNRCIMSEDNNFKFFLWNAGVNIEVIPRSQYRSYHT